MPNENENQNEMIDLDFSMEDVDISRPVLKGGTYDCTIAFTRMSETSQSKQPQLLIGYRLAQTAETIKGDQVNPGFTLTQRIMTQPTGKLTQKMINERLARVHHAATGEEKGKPNTSAWIGKPVRVAVKLREARHDKKTNRDYPPSNEVSNVYPAPNASATA